MDSSCKLSQKDLSSPLWDQESRQHFIYWEIPGGLDSNTMRWGSSPSPHNLDLMDEKGIVYELLRISRSILFWSETKIFLGKIIILLEMSRLITTKCHQSVTNSTQVRKCIDNYFQTNPVVERFDSAETGDFANGLLVGDATTMI